MNKYKVCVYAICKNEEQFVDRWMDSMGEADLVIVTDTGSEDGTVAMLERRGAIVHVDIVKPWRFDEARNISLAHVPEDVDICVCTDLDETFEPGWRKKLEAAWPGHPSETIARQGDYLYNWSLKPDGTPDVQFMYFKVHQRHGFTWRCPVHEYLQLDPGLILKKISIKGMVLNHYPDSAKSRGSYLPLLELAVDEMPADERMRYYLGREYMYMNEWQKCITTLKDYLSLPNALWKEERCAAMRWIAKSYSMLNEIKTAYSWYYKAVAEVPAMREPYVEFAQLCYMLADWPMTFYLAEEALKITDKSSSHINMGYSWDSTPDDLCAMAAFRMNMLDVSLDHALAALKLSPDSTRLQNNVHLIRDTINTAALNNRHSGQ